MLSRIADSLFWMNRYMERADSILRVTRTNYILSFDAGLDNRFGWNDILATFTMLDEQDRNDMAANPAAAMEYLITTPSNINAVKLLIVKARENAKGVQENITKELWEQVNHLYHLVNKDDVASKLNSSKAIEILDRLAKNSLLYCGITDSTMPRGQGWNFMNLGKFIERSLLSIEIANAHFSKIDYNLQQPQDILFWRNLLLSLSGYEFYLKNYTSGQHNNNVIDHVIMNRDFPRSLYYSMDRIKKYLEYIINETQADEGNMLQKLFGRLHSRIKFADLATMENKNLQGFLYSIRMELFDFSHQLSRIYFSYA